MESILFEDNPHWTKNDAYEHFIPREALLSAKGLLAINEIIAIIGARRVGKSTLAKLLIKELIQTGTEAKNIFFINLEKPLFIPYKNDASYLEKIYENYLKLTEPNRDQKIYFFIDEIQMFQNWEVFVKSKYETGNIKFIITGSNASLLTSELATLLTGRVVKMQLHSFSFTEFLTYKKVDFSNNLAKAKNKIAIQKAKEEYVKWGGYFSVISTPDEGIKKELLSNIAEDIILKDIVPRYKIKNASEIRDLFYYLVSNAATLINYASLAKKLGLDAKTIKEYLGYFEDNFLISTVARHHNKLTQTITSAKKLYVNDNGFLNLGVNPNRNYGNAFENLVFTVLSSKGKDIVYLKQNSEIDFLVDNTLIQVAYTIEDEKTRNRELKAFSEFRTPHQNALLVTLDTDESADNIEIVSFETFVFNSATTD